VPDVYQNPRVREEDLPLCYPADYFTHAGELVWEGHPATRGSLRDLVKRAVRHAADAVPEPGLRAPVRFLGAYSRSTPAAPPCPARASWTDWPRPGSQAAVSRGGTGLRPRPLAPLAARLGGLRPRRRSRRRRQRSGPQRLRVRVGHASHRRLPGRHFDLVYMSHVFEHLSDPVRAAERCLELLAPGVGWYSSTRTRPR